MARGAMLPWPGLVTAVANTTCSSHHTYLNPEAVKHEGHYRSLLGA